MADEAQIRSSLQILIDEVDYISRPTVFTADVSAGVGPTPGRVVATLAGADIDISLLTIPGLCRIQNLDSTNYVTLGIWDGVSFFPMDEWLPGETYVKRLSRVLGEEQGTGTGTITADVNTLRLKADTAPCECIVEIFEK